MFLVHPSKRRTHDFSVRRLSARKGFTLLELIITIALVGVLSVVAAARFQTASGFDTFALQGQLISSLRHMQLRAMQDTRSAFCHRLVFNTSTPAIGPPSNDYSNTESASLATCATSISTQTPDFLRIDAQDFNKIGASFSVNDNGISINYIGFDSLGRPLTLNANNCTNDCIISITAQSTANVCVNTEGFIRGC